MSLIITIDQEIKQAFLAKNQDRLRGLRAIKAALLVAKTEKGAGEINEEIELKILQRLAKQRKESADIYITQNREDLAKDELAELVVIEEFLPKQITDEELQTIIKNIILKVGAKEAKDMGKVMGVATKELAGKADGKKISDTVKQLLS